MPRWTAEIRIPNALYREGRDWCDSVPETLEEYSRKQERMREDDLGGRAGKVEGRNSIPNKMIPLAGQPLFFDCSPFLGTI